jgi:hypothetical protein
MTAKKKKSTKVVKKTKPVLAPPSDDLVESMERHKAWCRSDDRLSFRQELFQSQDLSRLSFRKMYFSNVTFADCDLRDADFQRAELYSCTFVRCDMRGTSLAHTTMEYSSFQDCDLRGAGFGGAEMLHITLPNSKLSRSTYFGFANLVGRPVIAVDNERDYLMRVIDGPQKGPYVVMGCRTFTLDEAWSHWQKYAGGVRDYFLEAIAVEAKKRGHKLKKVKV